MALIPSGGPYPFDVPPTGHLDALWLALFKIVLHSTFAAPRTIAGKLDKTVLETYQEIAPLTSLQYLSYFKDLSKILMLITEAKSEVGSFPFPISLFFSRSSAATLLCVTVLN